MQTLLGDTRMVLVSGARQSARERDLAGAMLPVYGRVGSRHHLPGFSADRKTRRRRR